MSEAALRRDGAPPQRRLVTLALVDGDGEPVGRLEPFEVPTPWWQDVLPINERVPGIAVLRMLSAEPPPGWRIGGRITYLAEVLDHAKLPRSLRLRPGVDPIDDHVLRMPWARPGGPAADLSWAASLISPSGPPRQHRTWNLSAIWSIPAGDTTVWLKCVPAFLAHEAAVLTRLSGGGVPELIGADAHRMLLAEMPGEDGYESTIPDHLAAVEALVTLQTGDSANPAELRAAGVPDMSWTSLLAAAEDVVARHLPASACLEPLLETVDRRVARIMDCGLGDVLVHGDAHPGNVRIGPTAEPPVWFDWGDSAVGHPLLDLGVLSRSPGGLSSERATVVLRRWLECWGAARPKSDPWRAWPLVQPLAALRFAVVYQRFLDNIEPSERPYHDLDVLPALEQAAAVAGVRKA